MPATVQLFCRIPSPLAAGKRPDLFPMPVVTKILPSPILPVLAAFTIAARAKAAENP